MQALACFEQVGQEEKSQSGFVKTVPEIFDHLPHLLNTWHIFADWQGELHGSEVQYAHLVTDLFGSYFNVADEPVSQLKSLQCFIGNHMVRERANAPQKELLGPDCEIR